MPREDRPRRCLVLPDANDQECATLFEFALRCASLRPDIGFALRPHPMVDAASLLRRHPAELTWTVLRRLTTPAGASWRGTGTTTRSVQIFFYLSERAVVIRSALGGWSERERWRGPLR